VDHPPIVTRRAGSEPAEHADGRESEPDDVEGTEELAGAQTERLLGELVAHALLPVERVLRDQQRRRDREASLFVALPTISQRSRVTGG
jgi:hypothetical protein